MTNLSNKQISRPRMEIAETHCEKLKRYVEGEDVRADDLLKAALFVVVDVLRRERTPSWNVDFFAEQLERVSTLASKYVALMTAWPGAVEPPESVIERLKADIDLLNTRLIPYAPRELQDGFGP